MNFGETIKTFLFLSEAKMKDLADVLSYDPSYISKWNGGSHLPNRKSIELVLTKSSHYFAQHILESGKDIHWPAYFSGTDVPETINNYHDLQIFIFNYLMAAYNQTDKEMHPSNELDQSAFASRNCYASYDLDEIMKTIHGVCNNALNKFNVLKIKNSLSLDDLDSVLGSQVQSYCMMFRSNSVQADHYMKKTDNPIEILYRLINFTTALQDINPQSLMRLYYAADDMGELILTQGCYLIYKYDVMGKPLYFMLNDNRNVEYYGDQILNYPYEQKMILSTAKESLVIDTGDYASFLQKDDFIINIRSIADLMIYTLPFMIENEHTSVKRYARTFQILLRDKKVSIIYAKSQTEHFLENLIMPEFFGSDKMTLEETKELINSFYDMFKDNENLKFYPLEDKDIEELYLHHNFIATPGQLIYLPELVENFSENIPAVLSKHEEFTNHITTYLNDEMEERVTGNATIDELYQYMVTYLDLIKQL